MTLSLKYVLIFCIIQQYLSYTNVSGHGVRQENFNIAPDEWSCVESETCRGAELGPVHTQSVVMDTPSPLDVPHHYHSAPIPILHVQLPALTQA